MFKEKLVNRRSNSYNINFVACLLKCYSRDTFINWMYLEAGGNENVESAVLGVLILWTTW